MIDNHLVTSDQLNELYKYAFTLCQSNSDAQDLVHSSFEKYLAKITSGKTISQPQAYIRTLIRNRFIDNYRYKLRWDSEPYQETEAYDISPIDVEKWLVDQSAFSELWNKLSVLERDALYHWIVLGFSTDEVSELMGVPRGTFLARMHRLKKRLQQDPCLQEAVND